MNKNSIVIYPGTFDPMTNGHLDLVLRAAKLFAHVVIAVANNERKSPFFSLDQRIKGVRACIEGVKNINVCTFDGLLVDFAHAQGAHYILRGLRSASDFEYEFQLAGMNKALHSEIETIFFTPDPKYLFISSSLVREIFSLGGDVRPFVPSAIQSLLFSAV